MYLPVTSLCSEEEGRGVDNSHGLGISAFTESRFSFANASQPAIALVDLGIDVSGFIRGS